MEFMSALLIAGFAFATPKVIHKAKWSANNTTEELTQICDRLTKIAEKLGACGIAVSRYAEMEIAKIPTQARAQAEFILKEYAAHPQESVGLFSLHNSHQTIGRIELASGQVTKAKEALLNSIKVPMTPPLETRGPRFTLAQELLKKGEKSAVLEYLTEVEKFWKDDLAKTKIEGWRREIKTGKIPDFKIH